MATRAAPKSALRRRDEAIVQLLEKVQRCRPLDADEETLLSRTVSRLTPRRAKWYWRQDEDQAIKDLLARRRRRKPAKPYQRNDEVRLLAERLGRTEWSVRRRMERLQKHRKAKRS